MNNLNKNNIQLAAGSVALIALLAYTWVHTGGLLARYVAHDWIGYVAAFGIEAAVVGLSLRIGDLKRSKQKANFFGFVLVAVVIVSAIANIAEGFTAQTKELLSLVTIRQLDPIQAAIGLTATGLISLIVLAMSEIIGTDIDALVKQAAKDDGRLTRLQQELAEVRKQLSQATKERDKAVTELDTIKAQFDKQALEIDRLKQETAKRPFDLDTIPPVLADYVTQWGEGVIPDGEFSDKWGVGASTVKRANSIFTNGAAK